MRVRHSEASCDISLIGFIFYGEVWSAPRPTPNLKDHLLSAVRDCLFNIFTAIWRPFLHPQPEDVPCRGDRDPIITDRDPVITDRDPLITDRDPLITDRDPLTTVTGTHVPRHHQA